MNSAISKLTDILIKNNIEYQENPSLKRLTTFKVGGEALFLVTVKNANELSLVVKSLLENKIKYMVIGNGSNLLFTDKGYNGVIIKQSFIAKNISNENDILKVAAGMKLSKLCELACEYSLAGLEFAYGIPGTVGGAIYMNAGAYDGEMKDVAFGATFVDEHGEIKQKDFEGLDLSYRHSAFTDTANIITDVSFKLKKGNKKDIREKMDELYSRRIAKQPLEYPSGGSTFKRPVGNYASALIDECGLKGSAIGGAMVSKKHAGFIINYDDASAKDVFELIEFVKNDVYEKTGYNLECEVKIIDY